MKLVIDSNKVFSAILNPSSLISKIIVSSSVDFYAPKFLKAEIGKYSNKIMGISGYSPEELKTQKEYTFNFIEFYDERKIKNKNLKKAAAIVRQIDPKDFLFIALCIELDCQLWTGDKKLKNGLIELGHEELAVNESVLNKLI